MTPAPTLFDPFELPGFTAPNRIAMAPMTRCRADETGVLPEYAAEYYRQRSSAGLIITEGTQPSFEGQGYCRTPGIHTPEQREVWSRVADAVHEEGSRIFLQVMHAGRIAHPLNRQTDAEPVAPSAIAPPTTQVWTDQEGMQSLGTPRALDAGEIPAIVDEYTAAARMATFAGFDGVELHAASGYLANQFLESGTNRRTDGYGGSIENRIRFVLELVDAMKGAIGAERVAVKISPSMTFNDMHDDDPAGLYSALVRELNGPGLAYLHVGEDTDAWDVHGTLRPLFDGAYLAGTNLTCPEEGQALLDAGVDMTVWGTRFIANPDLPERLRRGGPYNESDRATFYSAGPVGYTDYPTLDLAHATAELPQATCTPPEPD